VEIVMARATGGSDEKAEKSGSGTNLPDVMTRVYTLLKPLPPEDRRRVVESTFNLLGDKPMATHPPAGGDESANGKTPAAEDESEWKGFSSDAKRWAKRGGITREVLDEYFHERGGTMSVINIPDELTSKQARSVACYLLQGLAAYIQNGDGAAFDDETARKLCVSHGCYDQPNHARIFATMRGQLTGDKKSGWQLTKPGLATAAELIKPKDKK
jgi:hypothetical protein